MKTKKPDAELVWKQLEDLAIPRLRLSLTDRAVYYHLLRHSRLEGKPPPLFDSMAFARYWPLHQLHPLGNSYRNLVSFCLQCNSRKGERSALDFFRTLYRERRLSDSELAERLRALDALAAGKLRPRLDKKLWQDATLRRDHRPSGQLPSNRLHKSIYMKRIRA